MYIQNIFSSFSAAHKLKDYKGDCANIHGHNWKIRISIQFKKIDSMGMGKDFRKIKENFDNILADFDHKFLNALEYFKDKNPTSEVIAQIIFDKASAKFNSNNCKVKEIEVSESDKYSVTYTSDENN